MHLRCDFIIHLFIYKVNNKLPHKVKKLLFGVDNYDTGYIMAI
nr:MAG TPA: hypothetical protein [Caudoviricetes sp.]